MLGGEGSGRDKRGNGGEGMVDGLHPSTLCACMNIM